MRKIPSLLDALFPRVLQGILAAVLLHPEREWYMSDLARHLRTAPSSLQRLLNRLHHAGVITRRVEGNRVYYRADTNCPILPELQGMLSKTAGLLDVLRAALRPLEGNIDCAFVYGSIPAGGEHSGSDVDLMVIGSVGLAELAPVIRSLQDQIGREINPSVYTAVEFGNRARRANRFVTNVLRHAKMFVIGDEKDLDRIVEREAGRPGARQQAGNRRPAYGG